MLTNGAIIESLNRDLSLPLSQYAAQLYQTPLLLMDPDTFDDLIGKKRYFVTAPVHTDIKINKKIVIAPFTVKGKYVLAREYGFVFVVLDVLRNYEDEIEGLDPGHMIVTVESLFKLDESIINGVIQRVLH